MLNHSHDSAVTRFSAATAVAGLPAAHGLRLDDSRDRRGGAGRHCEDGDLGGRKSGCTSVSYPSVMTSIGMLTCASCSGKMPRKVSRAGDGADVCDGLK